MPHLRSCCFPAGTLVHTRDGLRSIESVPVGTYVLSRSAKTGEQGWKRVLHTGRHDARPLCHIRLHMKVGGEFVAQELLATDRHLFYVAGYFNTGGFSDEYWEELDKPIGWCSAEWLQPHQLVQLADGTTMQVSFVQHLWKTRSADHAWAQVHPESTTGWMLRIEGGKAIGDVSRTADTDYAGVDDFNERNSTSEMREKWAFSSPVFGLQVEEFQTYFVGERGVWVHDDSEEGPLRG